MGGTTGKLTHLGIGKETVWGTAQAAGAYLKFNSETLTHNIEELMEASINARRDEGNSYEGGNTIAGDTIHEVHPAGIGYLLRSAFRSPTTVDNTGSYTHVFQPPAGRVILADIAQASTSGSLIYLTAVATDDIYNGCWCHVKTGTAAGQWAIITDTAAGANTISVVTSPAAVATDTIEIMMGPESCVLPPYTLEVHRDLIGATAAFQYKGCIVNNLSFTMGVASKILTATASWIGKTVANIANTSPTLPVTDPFMWDSAVMGVGVRTSATATGGSASTLIDTTEFTVNAEIGNIVLTTGGTGPNQCRRIISNTADALTVSPSFTVAPAAGTTYKIFGANLLTENLTFGIANGAVGVPTLNYSKDIARIDSDAYRSGTISRTVIPQEITDYSTYFAGWQTREWCLYFHGAQITGAHYYDLIIHMPKVLFLAYPINVPGGGRITVADSLKIKYDATATYSMKVILQNNTSAY